MPAAGDRATRDLVGYGRRPPAIGWPGGARVAVSLTVHFEEGAERSPLEGDATAEGGTHPLLGKGGRRDLMLESLYEYGPRRGIWRLLEIFERHGVAATFLCAGQAVERNPEAARAITAAGHEACAHGYRWLPAHELGEDGELADIRRAVEAVTRTTGERPRGWHSRVPSVRTRPLLLEEGGFLYDSDAYDDDLPYVVTVDGRRWLTVPYTLDVTDEKFWASPTGAGFTRPEQFGRVMRGTLDRLYEEGRTHPKMMSVALRLRISGRPARAQQVDGFVRYAKSLPGVWFARRVDIAEWWLEHGGR